MVDSNCNPETVDHVIPSNDDAIRAIRLITSKMAEAALEGINMNKEQSVDSEVDADSYTYTPASPDLHDASEEQLLGPSTLANIADDGKASE